MDLLSAYLYPIGLALFSVVVAAAERRWPWRKEQVALRRYLWSDLIHLVFNGHFLGAVLAGLAANFVLPHIDAWLGQAGLMDTVYRNAASQWPLWVQIPVALVVVDFIQWSVHNLLHRVAFFWEFHKGHHSVKDGEMDWIVSFRFQWTEVVVYKTVLYLPLVWFGFGYEAIMFHALFGTLIGHLNHANLDLGHTWLRYIFNSPRMHLWHHDYDRDGTNTVNFGIIFSTWDWLFGTAYMPEHTPRALGFPGVETYPNDFFGLMAWPVSHWLGEGKRAATVGASVVGVLLVGGGYWAALPRALEARTPMMGEAAATSQPMTVAPAGADAYAASPEAATAALEAFGSEAKAAGYAHPEAMVSAAELAKALGSPRLVVLDVRPTARFEQGHIPGAVPIDRPDYSGGDIPGMSRPVAELQAALRARGVRQDAVVVLYGDGGPEPIRLWWTLRHIAGYEARVLDGNLRAWLNGGHGLAAGPGKAPSPGDVTLAGPSAPTPQRWQALQAFAADAVKLDTRSRAEFAGAEQRKNAAKKGRIPGSKHLEWFGVLRTEQDQRLKPVNELRALFTGLGITPGQTKVLSYCQSGTRSAAIAFALHQLGADPATALNYDGSWAEYSRLDLPVETD
ncbi:MAG: sterol desaturase family protein [Myxococcales bacterium]|nr:sterol desaturase family protein [Myxococcales bacterium]